MAVRRDLLLLLADRGCRYLVITPPRWVRQQEQQARQAHATAHREACARRARVLRRWAGFVTRLFEHDRVQVWLRMPPDPPACSPKCSSLQPHVFRG